MVTLYPRRDAIGWTARGGAIVAAVVYIIGAFFFYAQEQWARSPTRAETRPLSALHHPEAVLGILHHHSRGVYPPELRGALTRSLELAPSFYQGPLYFADFLAERSQEPQEVRELFEIAVRRFPANGRIRLLYAEWLLVARTDLAAFAAFDEIDPLPLAESYAREAITLEPDLTARALATLSRHHIPPERWTNVLPADAGSGRVLALALDEAGYREHAVDALRALIASTTNAHELMEAAAWAIDWEAPALALEASRRVPEDAPSEHVIRLTRLVARAHWALGEPNIAYDTFVNALKSLERRVGVDDAARLLLLCSAGDEYLQRGEIHVAESFYAEAAARNEGLVPAILGLARIHRRRNDNEASIDYYQQVLRLDHDHDAAKRELAALGAAR